MELSHFPGISDDIRLKAGPELWSNTSDDESRLDGDEPQRMRWNMLWLLTVIVATGAGNLLVCVAVCRERALQNMANYFLMSLAIADFLVSVTVMPVAMTVLLFGACASIHHCCHCVFYIVCFILCHRPILFIFILPYILPIQLLGCHSYNDRLSK